ncbi:MAG: phosphoribosylamine--glycine ligase [Nitrospirae bacterium]|nr:phosphoribosylamine--glycine ligase [Nitrospirota bacterium]
MKILVIGSGGREHAMVWKLSQSPARPKIYAIPGNPGIGKLAETVQLKVDDIQGILEFALNEKIDLTLVGPELPLSLGICDQFRKNGLKIVGPTQRASRIESSKAYSKEIMFKYQIPTATAEIFTSAKKAREFILKTPKPLVIKADGLAAGKGVVIAESDEVAISTIESFMEKRSLGNAGSSVLIEEFLEGEEISFLVITDGKHVLPLAEAQDHKKIFDGDMGPNTGGMGAYSPVPLVTETQKAEILNQIMIPIVRAMELEGAPFTGFLFGGLILTRGGIKVLEFNARLGDPETQVILTRLQSDFVELLQKTADGQLDRFQLKWQDEASVCVVIASAGYPVSSGAKVPITGLETINAKEDHGLVFHAGTEFKNQSVLASGGRVLGVTACGKSIQEARNFAYEAISKIHFDGMQYRKDIGLKAVNR